MLRRCGIVSAAPAAILALLCVLPFLNKPFTVDDVTFLLQAKHLLVDPLHPTAFEMVFDGERIRLSQQLVSGPVMGYLLVPSILLGGVEWLPHALLAAFLVAGAASTAVLGLRFGLTQFQAVVAALLLVSAPAVLGMTATAMPDVPAMAFAVGGMERFVAWRQTRRASAAVMAALLLALGALARPHVLLVIPCAALWLSASTESMKLDASRIARWTKASMPLIIAVVVVVFATIITRDPVSKSTVASATLERFLMEHFSFNLASFAAQWVVAFPLGLLWPVLRGSRFINPRRTFVAFSVGIALIVLGGREVLVDWRWRLIGMLWAGHGIDVLADIVCDAWERRDRLQLVLVAWMLIATVSAFYIQLPAKALIPSAPAMAILLARRMRQPASRIQIGGLSVAIALGVLVGVLVIRADTAMAEIGRRGGTVVAAEVRQGSRVWMDGGWGFQWYAMKAGALPLAETAPYPRPGDIVVASLKSTRLLLERFRDKTLLSEQIFRDPGGRVFGEGAGFFSNYYGLSPWAWGREEVGRIEVWRIDPPSGAVQ